MNTSTALTEDQVNEFQTILGEVKGGWAQVKDLPATFETMREENAQLQQQVKEVRRLMAGRVAAGPGTRAPGLVSDECARQLAAHLVAHCHKSDRLAGLCSVPAQRDALIDFACETLNLTTRASLTTSDVPLPSQFGGEIRALISEFGVVRRRMAPYPIGMGTSRPARMGARPAFGSVAMSAAFGEKSPNVSFASLESHKIGGIVRLPREIDEQSIVQMGQFLARYGAVEFARAEDTWGFLADGGGTYESVRGVVQIARDEGRTQTLASTKTKPSDATLDDFRALRRQVNKAALNGRLSAYYLDSTWETRLGGVPHRRRAERVSAAAGRLRDPGRLPDRVDRRAGAVWDERGGRQGAGGVWGAVVLVDGRARESRGSTPANTCGSPTTSWRCGSSKKSTSTTRRATRRRCC